MIRLPEYIPLIYNNKQASGYQSQALTCCKFHPWLSLSVFSISIKDVVLNYAQRSSISAVADFKAITCPPLQKFIKCTDFDFTTSPAIALIHC